MARAVFSFPGQYNLPARNPSAHRLLETHAGGQQFLLTSHLILPGHTVPQLWKRQPVTRVKANYRLITNLFIER